MAFTRALDLATGSKRGPVVVGFAIAGMVIAWAVQLPFLPLGVPMPGLIAVGVGVLPGAQAADECLRWPQIRNAIAITKPNATAPTATMPIRSVRT